MLRKYARWIPRALAVPAALLLVAADQPAPAPDFGPMLERFTYPWPVQTMEVDIVGAPAQMAFMDIAPQRPNGRAVVLLHGKNFCGATWGSTARALSDAGYRVIVPDQIGRASCRERVYGPV